MSQILHEGHSSLIEWAHEVIIRGLELKGTRVPICMEIDDGRVVEALDLDEITSRISSLEGGVVEVAVVEGLVHVAYDVKDLTDHLSLSPGVLKMACLVVREHCLSSLHGIDGVVGNRNGIQYNEATIIINWSICVVPVIEVVRTCLLNVISPNSSFNKGIGATVSEEVEVTH